MATRKGRLLQYTLFRRPLPEISGTARSRGNTQVLLIVTAEFDGPSVDDVHGPGTERRR